MRVLLLIGLVGWLLGLVRRSLGQSVGCLSSQRKPPTMSGTDDPFLLEGLEALFRRPFDLGAEPFVKLLCIRRREVMAVYHPVCF